MSKAGKRILVGAREALAVGRGVAKAARIHFHSDCPPILDHSMWDHRAGIYIATSPRISGLITEAATLEALKERLPGATRDRLQQNGNAAPFAYEYRYPDERIERRWAVCRAWFISDNGSSRQL